MVLQVVALPNLFRELGNNDNHNDPDNCMVESYQTFAHLFQAEAAMLKVVTVVVVVVQW